MTESSAVEPEGQAGSAVSEAPAEGSVLVGEEADPTDDGQSSSVAEVEDPTAVGDSSTDPAEG